MALLFHTPLTFTNSKLFSDKLPIFGKLHTLNTSVIASNCGVRVFCKVEDFKVSHVDHHVGLNPYGLFSAPVKLESRPSKEEDEKQNYYLNLGYAIRTLREEFPEIFLKELSFNIYRFVQCLREKI